MFPIGAGCSHAAPLEEENPTCHRVVSDLAQVRKGDTRDGILLDQALCSLQQDSVEMLQGF